MKHSPSAEITERVGRFAEQLNVRPDDTQLTWLARHLERVLETNKHFNLTAVEDPGEAARLLTADSLSAMPEVLAAPPGLMADLGSGAGFPGIPLSIMSVRPVILVESTAKKAGFLQELADELAGYRDVRVANTRIEELALRESATFSLATARALSSLPSLVELAVPLLAWGGHFVALKGRIEPEELERGDAVASLVGARRASVREFALPLGGEARAVVVYERVEESGVKLPRRVGLAQRRPLA